MMELRISSRGHQSALKKKFAMACCIEGIIKDKTMNQKAYGTLASWEMHTETVDQLVNLPRRAVSYGIFTKK